jgi:hypothetical protein
MSWEKGRRRGKRRRNKIGKVDRRKVESMKDSDSGLERREAVREKERRELKRQWKRGGKR